MEKRLSEVPVAVSELFADDDKVYTTAKKNQKMNGLNHLSIMQEREAIFGTFNHNFCSFSQSFCG